MREIYWVAFKTIIHKEVSRFLRIWMQTLVPPVITMTLYFLIFGTMIGSRIGPVSGYNYMQYIAPGLIMMSVITSSYANVCFSFYATRFQHSIEEILVSPTPNVLILSGYLAAGVLRGLLVGTLVTCIALFFTKLHMHSWFLTITSAFLASLLFSLLGFLNALFARNFDDTSIVPTFVLTPLTYLGGVFYSVSLLPSFWRELSYANPILYIVNAFRDGVLGVSDVNIYFAFGMMTFFIALALGANLYFLEKGTGLRT